MSKGLGEQLTYSGSSLDARETIILLEGLTVDGVITNISNAYPGLKVKVIERLEKSDFTGELTSSKIYEIKKTSNRNKPLSASQGGYELIKEPRDLKYSDGVTPFLNNDGNIDADYLKLAEIDGSEEKSIEDDFNVKTDTLRIDGTTYGNSKKEEIRATIGAQENITSMQNVQPVVAALNDRTADVVPVTNEVKALGYKVLNPAQSFAEQVTAANTIYEIRDSFEIAGSATIPANCTLKFNGGAVRGNGSLTLANTKLEGNIIFGRELYISGKASNDTIKVEWLGAVGDGETDDSNALKNAIAILKQKNSTLVFGDGKTYLHGDGIADLTNDPDMTLHTGYSYPRASENPAVADYLHPSGPAAIGRDIVLRFLGFDGLTIEGNGSTIVSNPNNGICMHNAMFFFGACANMVVRNLNVNGNRTLRVANAEIQFNDWSTGSYPTYPNGIIPSWMEQVWIESAADALYQAGYNLISNIHVAACHDVLLENVDSTDAMIDCLMVNKASNDADGYSYNVTTSNCSFSYAARSGFDIGQGKNVLVTGCHYERNGYCTNNELDTVGSANHGGFTTELESNPINFEQITCRVEASTFKDNDQGGVKLSTGTINSVVSKCYFDNSNVVFSNGSATGWQKPYNNVMEECTLLNSKLGPRQSGVQILNNTFLFDKNFNKEYTYDMSVWTPYFMNINVSFEQPIVFKGNKIEVDVSELTKEYNGAVYWDSTKTKGQGRFRALGSVVVRDNIFKNAAPTVKSFEGFIGRSGDILFVHSINGVIENNTFIDEISKVYYIASDVEKYDGKTRVDGKKDYSNYNEDNIANYNNTVEGLTTTIKEVPFIGTTAQRPNLQEIVDDVSKVVLFTYQNTEKKTNEYFNAITTNTSTSLATISQNSSKNQCKVTPFESEQSILIEVLAFPRNIIPKVFFTKKTNTPNFEADKYYKLQEGQYIVLTSVPSNWTLGFGDYYELDGEGNYVKVTGTPMDEVLDEAIEVPLSYTNYATSSQNIATAYIKAPDSTIYPFVLCQKTGDYSTQSVFRYKQVISKWIASDGYASVERKGTTANRPVGLHLDNGDYVGDLTSEDVGLMYFDTDIKKPIYVASVNDTTGVVLWVDGLGEPAGLQVSDTSVLIGAAQNSSKTINVYSESAITAVSQVIDETSITYTTGSTADTIESTSYYAGSAISLNEGDIIRIDGTAVILNSSKDAIVAFTSGKSYIASGTETIYIATTTADTDVVYIKGNWLEASVGTASGSTYPVTLKALSANSTAPRGAKVIITNNSEVVVINVVQSY